MDNKKDIVEEHIEKLHMNIEIIVPSHPDRSESAIFRKSKQKLKDDGNYKCWICNSKENIEVYHFAVEWSEQSLADLEKIKQFVEIFDPYNYGKQMKDIPLESVEDPRCLLCLCRTHHCGSGTNSIHSSPFPFWIMQKLSKDNLDPVVQKNETIEMVEKRIKEFVESEVLNEKNK